MVGVAGDADIVVEVDSERVHERFRGVFATFEHEFFGTFAQISVEDALEADFPLTGDFLGFVLGDGIDVGLQQREELVEVVERVAIERAGEGHCVFGADAVSLHRGEHVLSRATLCKLAVAVEAHDLNGAVHVGFVGDKRLTEVVFLARGLQDFGLEVREGRVGPAGARAVLVFHRGDGNLLHDGENGFVTDLCRCFLLGCAHVQCEHGEQCHHQILFHCFC